MWFRFVMLLVHSSLVDNGEPGLSHSMNENQHCINQSKDGISETARHFALAKIKSINFRAKQHNSRPIDHISVRFNVSILSQTYKLVLLAIT